MLNFSRALAIDITPELVDAIFGESEKNFEWALNSLENIVSLSNDLIRQTTGKDKNIDDEDFECLIDLSYYDSSIKEMFLKRIQENHLKQSILIRRLLKMSYCFKKINLIEFFNYNLIFQILGTTFNNVETEIYCFKLLLVIQCCYPDILQTCSRIQFISQQQRLIEFFNSNIKLDFTKNLPLYHNFIEYYLNLYYLTPFKEDKEHISRYLIELALAKHLRDYKLKDYLVLNILIKVGDNYQDEDYDFFIAPIFENTISYFLSLPIYYASNSSYVNKEELLKLHSRRIFHIAIANDVNRLIQGLDIDLTKYDVFVHAIICCDIDLVISIYSNLTQILTLPTRQQVVILYNKIAKLLEIMFNKLKTKSKLPKHQRLMLESYELPKMEKFVFGIMSSLSISNEKLFDITETIVETLLQDTKFYVSNIVHILNWIKSIANLNIVELSVQTFSRLITNLNDCLEIILDKQLPTRIKTQDLINSLQLINFMILQYDDNYESIFVNNISFNTEITNMIDITFTNINKIIAKLTDPSSNELIICDETKIKKAISSSSSSSIKDKEAIDTKRYIKYILDIDV